MAHHGREIAPEMAHLAEEGTASQEAGAVLARFGS
jgi:lipoic acid synthetase